MKNQPQSNIWERIDWLTVGLFLVMVILGWINIYSAEYKEEHRSIFTFSERYGKQFVWIILALVIAFFTITLDAKFYSFFGYFIYGLMIFSLFLVLFIGRQIHGSKSWFVIGSLQIQPSEFAKFATALALSKYLSSFDFHIHRFRSLVTMAAIIFFPAVLILVQPDTGSAIIYFSFLLVLYREGLSAVALLLGLSAVVLFILTLLVDKLVLIMALMGISIIVFWAVSRNRKAALLGFTMLAGMTGLLGLFHYLLELRISTYYILIVAVLLSGVPFAYYIYRYRIRHAAMIFMFLVFSIFFSFSVDYVFHRVLSSSQQKRINVVLGIQADPFGDGYNVNQSKIAIGSGGFFGKGFLHGTQTKFKFVPEQSTDFIFCTVGEEFGFLGTTVVIALFVFLMLRIVQLAEKQRSAFSRIYGYCVFSIFLAHLAINIGMTIGLVPVIGIPLPFFSYGGSSLWAFTILLFIFVRLDASRLELVG
jgi:rod shape determining protein RodA